MKFVHLAPQPSLGRIKKNGIRFGGGRRGSGVYAVPVMLMEQAADEDRRLRCEARSSIHLWKWLAGSRHRHRNLAAVVFDVSAEHWPATLYILVSPEIGTSWVSLLSDEHVDVDEESLELVRSQHALGASVDLAVAVHGPATLGRLMNVLRAAGFTTLSRYDESLEIVFPAPIPAKSIDRIIPLYRTNVEFARLRRNSHESW